VFKIAVFLFAVSTFAAAKPYDPCRSVHQKITDTVLFLRNRQKSPILAARNAEHGVDLERRIRFYQEITGRTATEKDVRRARIATSVLQSLKFDRKFATIDALSPLFQKMHLAYHLYLHNERVTAELGGLISQLESKSIGVAEFQNWVATHKIEEAYLTRALASGEPAQVLGAARKLEKDFQRHTRRLMKIISGSYDEYEASRSMLEACAKFQDEIGSNAQFVLDRLTSEKLLPNFFSEVPFTEEHRASPKYSDIKDLIKRTPEMADHRRWWIGTRELFAAILSLSPTDALFHYLDRAASNIPWVNKPRFRAMLQFLQSERAIIVYYPDIQRVIEGSADAEMKLEMLEYLNSPTNDILLNTFARRLDARKTWAEMKAKAEAREDKTLFNKMVAADEARQVLGELVLWHHPRVSQGIRTFFDMLIFSGGSYLATTKTPLGGWIAGFFTGNEEEDDDEKDRDKEVKEVTAEWKAVMEKVATDPEAKVFRDEAKTRSPEVFPEIDSAFSFPYPLAE